MLLLAAAFLVNVIKFNDVPRGISLVSVLYTLAKQAIFLGAYQVACFAHTKLHILITPSSIEDSLELDIITIKVRPSYHYSKMVAETAHLCV